MADDPLVTPAPAVTASPEVTTAPSVTSAPAETTAAPSLINSGRPTPWAPYTDDTTKTAEENAQLRVAHNATAPAAQFTELKLDALKVPDGFQLNEERSKQFLEIWNNPNLSRAEVASALLNLQAETLNDLQETGKKRWDDTQTDWTNKVKSDPVYGGEQLPATLDRIGGLLDAYGNDEVRTAFDLTGAGNHPAIVGFLNQLALKLGEPGPAPAPQPGGGNGTDLASRMFPSMKN